MVVVCRPGIDDVEAVAGGWLVLPAGLPAGLAAGLLAGLPAGRGRLTGLAGGGDVPAVEQPASPANPARSTAVMIIRARATAPPPPASATASRP